MQDEPRILQLSSAARKVSNQKPLREYVILLPNGKQIRQKAHEWCEVTAESDESVSALCIAFYVDRQRVLTIPYDAKLVVMDTQYCDVEATVEALKPVRKPRAKRKIS